jgi:hypothetical protein
MIEIRALRAYLLKTVFGIAHEMADRKLCVGVVVDAKPATREKYRSISKNSRTRLPLLYRQIVR